MKTQEILSDELRSINKSNTLKREIPLESPQAGLVTVKGKSLVMLASNNYLGMSNHPVVKKAAIEGIKEFGYGVASARFLCGTQTIHRQLEKKIATFVGTEDSMLFSSSFAANIGFFSSLTNEKLGYEQYRDVIYSDRLNHASIIDGQRLCRQENTDKKIYNHGDTDHLRQLLEEDKHKEYRFRIIATDGVFSMEGDMAPLPELRALAREYQALLFVDDAHGIGVCGKRGRGCAEHFTMLGDIDVIVGTLGKAIGGAAGGFIASNKTMIEYLRQKARTYIFSNSLPPAIVTATIAAFDLLAKDKSIVRRLHENTSLFRAGIKELGFSIIDGAHPIVPIMVGEASTAQKLSDTLFKHGVYVKGLWFPVVPKGEARLRAQISSSHTKKDLSRALKAFEKVGRAMGLI